MYGSELALPATGALGGGVMAGAVHTSSLAMAVVAAIMLLGVMYTLLRNAMRRQAHQRP